MNTGEVMSRKLDVIRKLCVVVIDTDGLNGTDEEFIDKIYAMKELNRELSEFLLIVGMSESVYHAIKIDPDEKIKLVWNKNSEDSI